MATEIEVKILNIEPKIIRERLKALGAKREVGLHKQTRYVFDIAKGDSSKWIRLRTTHQGTTLTVKKIVSESIDGTLEFEVKVDDEAVVLEMLKLMGFEAKSYQENYREVYFLDQSEVTIDFWPKLKPYVEIEAKDKKTVLAIAKKLGYKATDLSTENTMALYTLVGIELDLTPRLIFDVEEEPTK